MAETGHYKEQISTYLRELMEDTKKRYGPESSEYQALYYQYITNDSNPSIYFAEQNSVHYDACYKEAGLQNIERLYKRQASIDITFACLAHCRYCLRQNYTTAAISFDGIQKATEYFSKDEYLKEILITGGDPLLSVDLLITLMQEVVQNATNIRVIRIGTRLPVQGPEYLSDRFLDFCDLHRDIQFEVGIQINHPIELQAQAVECIQKLQSVGIRVYAQNVLLRNVNDNIACLIELYDRLRYMGVESHYLFHPVPIVNTGMYRMPISQFLEFSRLLNSSGEISGRAKPHFAIMTDVGKVILYHGAIGEKDENGYVEIKTGYSLKDRMKWHKGYVLPNTARIGDDGYIYVKYLDGKSGE